MQPIRQNSVRKVAPNVIMLQEVIIVGARQEQVKFSELTLDMFRMLQTMEREAQEDMPQVYDVSPGQGRAPFVSYIPPVLPGFALPAVQTDKCLGSGRTSSTIMRCGLFCKIPDLLLFRFRESKSENSRNLKRLLNA